LLLASSFLSLPFLLIRDVSVQQALAEGNLQFVECFLVRVSDPFRFGFSRYASSSFPSNIMTTIAHIRSFVDNSPLEHIDMNSARTSFLGPFSRPSMIRRIRGLLQNLPPPNLTSLAPLRECRHGLDYVMFRLADIVDEYFSLVPGPYCVHYKICLWIQHITWYMHWFINLFREEVIEFEYCRQLFYLTGKILIAMRSRLMCLSTTSCCCWVRRPP